MKLIVRLEINKLILAWIRWQIGSSWCPCNLVSIHVKLAYYVISVSVPRCHQYGHPR